MNSIEEKLPMCGDILLLVGEGGLSKPNTFYQGVARGTKTEFSHVAIVFSPLSIVDAVPDGGVRIRKWKDVSSHYNLDKSIVIRNSKILNGEINSSHIKPHIEYYYTQKYSVTSLFNWHKKLLDNKGVVCSQFVAAVFNKLGLTVSDKDEKKTLPVDIDLFTQEKEEWIRFKYSEYEFDIFNEVDRLFGLGESISFFEYCEDQIYNISNLMSKHNVKLNKVLDKAVKDFFAGKINLDKFQKTVCHISDMEIKIDMPEILTAWENIFTNPDFRSVNLVEDTNLRYSTESNFVRACSTIDILNRNVLVKHESGIEKSINKIKELGVLLENNNCQAINYEAVLELLRMITDAFRAYLEYSDTVFKESDHKIIEKRLYSVEKYKDKFALIPDVSKENALKTLEILREFDYLNHKYILRRPLLIELIEFSSNYILDIESFLAENTVQ